MDTAVLPSPRVVTPPASYSLSISGDFDLGASVFKDGYPFLHNDGGPTVGNTAVGLDALVSSTPGYPSYSSGRHNTALGDSALRNNTTGHQNTASGAWALYSNTTGAQNTASGVRALTNNTTGVANTASGRWALFSNTTGDSNTASGARALFFNTAASDNTASGAEALFVNTVGGFNTASGSSALRSNTTGWSNTAGGADALRNNTTGFQNIGLGRSAGRYNTSGSNNIWVGNYGSTESNTLRIGNGTGTGAFQQNRAFISGIRGATTGVMDALAVYVDSNDQLGTISSSRRVKEDIRDMGEASRGLHRLRPVTFRFKKASADGTRPVRYGLVAEEVAEVFPELVAYDEEGRPEAVLYHLLHAMLLNEIQKQQHQIQNQERTIAWQEAELKRLRAVQARVEAQDATLLEHEQRLRELSARLVRVEAAETARERPVRTARR